MLHARLFTETQKFRDAHFQPVRKSAPHHEGLEPWLDGNPANDRPLFVQFCANDPDALLEAARHVQPYCDAVDLNLGCPQGIARSGHYGAFLQEDWETIYKMIHRLHVDLLIPVTAKMRILETKEKTLEYAKLILSAGASIITVHGRRREQKGQLMGVADWSYIRYLRDNLPPETVIFANGNILNRDDIQPCLEVTGADGIMSAEGNLSDPTIFAPVPSAGQDSREYWRGFNGQEGYRIDGVMRRYFDIIYRYVLDQVPPDRPPLFVPTDPNWQASRPSLSNPAEEIESPAKKRKREESSKAHSPNLKPIQGHLFQLLRPMLSTRTDIRDTLAKCRTGDVAAFERVLTMVEDAVKEGLQEEYRQIVNQRSTAIWGDASDPCTENGRQALSETVAKYKRPWWVCQPYIRPLPDEAVKIGAVTVSTKMKRKQELEEREKEARAVAAGRDHLSQNLEDLRAREPSTELPRAALVCG